MRSICEHDVLLLNSIHSLGLCEQPQVVSNLLGVLANELVHLQESYEYVYTWLVYIHIYVCYASSHCLLSAPAGCCQIMHGACDIVCMHRQSAYTSL